MSATVNSSVHIEQVDLNDEILIEKIEVIARQIWTEHYSPIIGIKQVNYMLDKFQSKEAMKRQMMQGYQYYAVLIEDLLIGYFSVQLRESSLFLSKAYLLKDYRGKGIFSTMMSFIEHLGNELGANQIELTVNKYNSGSHKVYEAKGFIREEEAVFDIGNGYVMDDYIYLKHI